MKFGAKILEYKDELLHDFDELIRIPSVSASDRESAAKALRFVLGRAEQMGFTVKNVNDIAGHIEYGEGSELAAVLAHVDVVPAGEGWSSDPYRLTERNGRFYGRGVVDDKGPAIAALYGLKALKDNNIGAKRRLRLILGAAEEIGMDDMTEYFAQEEMPDIAFTPDSDYGICCREKGILQIEICSARHDGKAISELHAGTAVNAVPFRAEAVLNSDIRNKFVIPQGDKTNGYDLMGYSNGTSCADTASASDGTAHSCGDGKGTDSKDLTVLLDNSADDIKLTAFGKAAHACVPHEGINAASHLIRFLKGRIGADGIGSLCAFLDEAVGFELDGHSLGIACEDKESGALTVNLGVVEIDSERSIARIDIRYPVTADCDKLFSAVSTCASRYGLSAKLHSSVPPLSMDENSPVILMLRDAYKSVTGCEPEIYSTGGGTYARTLNNHGVAFGPVFKGDPAKIHDADEGISVENYFLHAQICLEAMYNMCVKS